MSRRRHTAEQIITALREAEVALANGKTVREVIRELGVGSDLTWRALGAVAYELSDRLALFVEYGVLAVDYTTDARELSGTVTYDTTRHGPRIGARTTF